MMTSNVQCFWKPWRRHDTGENVLPSLRIVDASSSELSPGGSGVSPQGRVMTGTERDHGTKNDGLYRQAAVVVCRQLTNRVVLVRIDEKPSLGRDRKEPQHMWQLASCATRGAAVGEEEMGNPAPINDPRRSATPNATWRNSPNTGWAPSVGGGRCVSIPTRTAARRWDSIATPSAPDRSRRRSRRRPRRRAR